MNRPPGRPRDSACDDAIGAAVLETLVEDGYDGMTMDRVAERAGVGRATIYRRWPSKADMIVHAIRQRSFDNIHDSDTGDPRADFQAMLQQAAAAMTREHRLLLVLQIELERHPELGEVFRRDFIDERRASFRQVLERGVQHGQLAAGADLETLTLLGPAVIWHQLTIGGHPPDPRLAQRLTAIVFGPEHL